MESAKLDQVDTDRLPDRHYVFDDTANFFKCSMNTCNDTSSVRTGAPPS